MFSNPYGETAISERTCRAWFQRFKNGKFRFEDAELEALLNADSCQSQEELT